MEGYENLRVLNNGQWCTLHTAQPSRFVQFIINITYDCRYVANGTQYYIISILSYFTLIYFFPYLPIAIYIYFADIVSTLNIIALVLCVFLIVKGVYTIVEQ